MSRYIRGHLERLQGRLGKPESPEAGEARARTVEHLDAIAQARREGTWTGEDAAREREALRAAAQKRRLVGGRLYRT